MVQGGWKLERGGHPRPLPTPCLVHLFHALSLGRMSEFGSRCATCYVSVG